MFLLISIYSNILVYFLISLINQFRKRRIMETKSTSVSYMEKYLKYALTFEKYVYIWQNAMNEANSQIHIVNDEIQWQQNTLDSSQYALDNLDRSIEEKHKSKQKTARQYIILALIALLVFLISLAFCLAVGYFSTDAGAADRIRDAIGIGIFMFFRKLIGPIAFIMFLFGLVRAGAYIREAKKTKVSFKQRETILHNNKNQAINSLSENEFEKGVLIFRRNEISAALQTAKKNLSMLYSENILPAKYRNFSAVAKLYEYLSTGRCNTLYGGNGIYDTFEKERIQIFQLEALIRIENSLEEIKENQRLLYNELRDANATLSSIDSTLHSIEKTAERIEENTAISATANQQTAVASQYLAWRAWANS